MLGDYASTSVRCHSDVMCLLGPERIFSFILQNNGTMDRLVKLTGPHGTYIYVTEVNGLYYQAHPEIHGNVEEVHSNFKARSDDVIICSYPKSGESMLEKGVLRHSHINQCIRTVNWILC